MPEGRMLKKAIAESKSLGNLKSDSARLLYTWLIPFLDVEGRHSADPEIVKGHIFPKVQPMTTTKISTLLRELNGSGLITLYQTNGEIYLQLNKFHDHQRVDRGREKPSKIPSPDKENIITPENSGVTPSNSTLSKDKLSKDKLIQASREDEFSQFWDAYPKRVAKKDALDAFIALRKTIPLADIASAVNGYNAVIKREQRDMKFIMYPATFLRNEKWKDFVGVKYSPPL